MNQNWFVLAVLFIPCLALADRPHLNLRKKETKSAKLPPCKACVTLVESFKKGMEKTARGKHDGGDAAWEEQRLKNYKVSELRLVEIQESLCKDVNRGEDHCHSLASEHEFMIEEWWFKHQDTHPELHVWLCIESLSVCCPPDHYGPNCDKCTECNGNGVCKGNGTRKGSGKCSCDYGYTGETCHECIIGHYESFRDESKLLCSECHDACDASGCTTSGPKGCRVCKSGWIMLSEEGGCSDIDECANMKHTCTENQFCVNTQGSYSCLECDKTCKGCSGDGPDLCNECAEGFELQDGICKDLTSERRHRYVNFTRYLTYLGLCIATCVIFQSSTTVAAIVGLAVALYISISEYWLNTTPSSSSANSQRSFEEFLKD